MTTILTIVSSSETTLTTKKMISGEEMMTIMTIASSSETMTTIKIMISNKKMLTSLGNSKTIVTTIINYLMTIATIVSRSKAFAYI